MPPLRQAFLVGQPFPALRAHMARGRPWIGLTQPRAQVWALQLWGPEQVPPHPRASLGGRGQCLLRGDRDSSNSYPREPGPHREQELSSPHPCPRLSTEASRSPTPRGLLTTTHRPQPLWCPLTAAPRAVLCGAPSPPGPRSDPNRRPQQRSPFLPPSLLPFVTTGRAWISPPCGT